MLSNLKLEGFSVDIKKVIEATNAKIVSRVFTLHTYKYYDGKYYDDSSEEPFAHFENAAKGVCTFDDYITEDVTIEIGDVKIDTHINSWGAEDKEVNYIPETVYTWFKCGIQQKPKETLEEAVNAAIESGCDDFEIWKHDRRASPESGVEVNEEEYKSILEALE